jgi:mannose-6-phosphate isomerase-like protein (cupin superfamily)
MKQAKIWGVTQDIWKSNNVEIHRIDIKQNGFCSKHLHEFKFNMFFIESGTLQIDVWDDATDKNKFISTIISDGESSIVEPKMFHKFTAIEPTIAYEIYWTSLIGEDIIRESLGGFLNV